jgi:hypothetical protein
MARTSLRRRAATVAVTLLASVVVPLIAASPASAGPPFTQCPAIGLDTSCGALITLATGSPPTAAIAFDTTQGPYEGADDTLVGVDNSAGFDTVELQITCSGCPNPIFGFDGDGLCTVTPSPALCPFGPTGYEGPDVTYVNYCAPSCNTGTVVIDFGPGTTCGTPPSKSAYFSLEDSLTAASVLTITVLTPKAEAFSNMPNPFAHAGPVPPPFLPASSDAALADTGPGVVRLEAMRTHAEASYTTSLAYAYTGKASVAAPLLVATGVEARAQAKCVGTHRFYVGSTTIADLSMNGVSQGAVTPGPNTMVAIPQCGAGGGVTLNEIVPYGGSGIQVTAIHVTCPLLGVDARISVARVWF